MAYSGKYKVKNYKKYMGDPTQVVYRSLWEKHAFKWCDDNPKIKRWGSEEVIIPYLYEVDKRYHRYFMDLVIEYADGKTVLVEIKPANQTTPPTGSRRTKRFINEAMTYVKNQNKWEFLPVSLPRIVVGTSRYGQKKSCLSWAFSPNPQNL